MNGQNDRPTGDHPTPPRLTPRITETGDTGHRVTAALRTLEQTRLRLVRPDDTAQHAPLAATPPPTRASASGTQARRPSLRTNNSPARKVDDSFGAPITDPTDPRWVMAVRTASELEGTILRRDRRERLLALGKRLGLSPFDANLIIAIIQDQARRGYSPEYCPTAGEPQLRMVPRREQENADRRTRTTRLSFLIAAVLAIEILFLAWKWG